jgi:hypothetical protein
MSALHRIALCSLACFACIPLQAAAWDRGKAELFATLPEGARFPEGITANPASGDIFVGTFDAGAPNNQLLRFDRHGRLEASRAFGTTPLLGWNSIATSARSTSPRSGISPAPAPGSSASRRTSMPPPPSRTWR